MLLHYSDDEIQQVLPQTQAIVSHPYFPGKGTDHFIREETHHLFQRTTEVTIYFELPLPQAKRGHGLN